MLINKEVNYYMENRKKVSPIIKVILSLILLIALSGMGVMAVTTKMSNVDITLADGYTINVLTTKNNVGEILKDNNILLNSDEKVTPSEDENITDEKKIVIPLKIAYTTETTRQNHAIPILKVAPHLTLLKEVGWKRLRKRKGFMLQKQ